MSKFANFWPKIGYFGKNRASRKPYKAPENLESRDTALFIIFYYRGSSEPTEAFCLCLKVKISSRMAKMSILRAIFCVFKAKFGIFDVKIVFLESFYDFLGKFWCFFL